MEKNNKIGQFIGPNEGRKKLLTCLPLLHCFGFLAIGAKIALPLPLFSVIIDLNPMNEI